MIAHEKGMLTQDGELFLLVLEAVNAGYRSGSKEFGPIMNYFHEQLSQERQQELRTVRSKIRELDGDDGNGIETAENQWIKREDVEKILATLEKEEK
jgi:hypothetical protein